MIIRGPWERGISGCWRARAKNLGNRENRRNVADAAVVVAYCRHTKSYEDMRLFVHTTTLIRNTHNDCEIKGIKGEE